MMLRKQLNGEEHDTLYDLEYVQEAKDCSWQRHMLSDMYRISMFGVDRSNYMIRKNNIPGLLDASRARGLPLEINSMTISRNTATAHA
jgi:hypothetical protein